MVKEKKTRTKKQQQPVEDDVEMTHATGDVDIAARLELQRTRVICGPDMNYHVRCS